MNRADNTTAQIFREPHCVTPINTGLPKVNLLIDGGFCGSKKRFVFELGKYLTPDAVFEHYDRFGIGHRGITNIVFGAGFGSVFTFEGPNHRRPRYWSSNWLTRCTFASSWSVLASRISAFMVMEIRAPYGCTASTQSLSTPMTSSQSPSISVNIEDNRGGNPEFGTTSEAAATARATKPVAASSALLAAASAPSSPTPDTEIEKAKIMYPS